MFLDCIRSDLSAMPVTSDMGWICVCWGRKSVWQYCLEVWWNTNTTWKPFPHYRSFVRGIQQLPVDPLHKGPVILSYYIFLVLAWANCWTNSWVASDLILSWWHVNERNVVFMIKHLHWVKTSWCLSSTHNTVWFVPVVIGYIDGLVQDCNISSVIAIDILQSLH